MSAKSFGTLFERLGKRAGIGQVHRAGARQVQKLLARLGSRFPLIVYDASFPGRITRLIQNISGLRQGPAGASGAS
jgi:hypothetical protein